MNLTTEILRYASFDADYSRARHLRCGESMILVGAMACPTPARIQCAGVVFTSEFPQNAGDAATINQTIEALAAS